MQGVVFGPNGPQPLPDWPEALPAQGFAWVALSQQALSTQLAQVQAALTRWVGGPLVDLHVSDLLNAQLPSNFDQTGRYDLLVLRRLAQSEAVPEPRKTVKAGGPPALRHIDTRPVGFVVYDRLLLTVHPPRCGVLASYQQRLQAMAQPDAQSTASHEPGRSAPVWAMPHSPSDLMLRLAGLVVDGYLELRRDLTRQLDHWQTELMRPDTRFNNWTSVLQARTQLHQLEELCEDQHTALQAWSGVLSEQALADNDTARQHHELLRVRTRDVIEHIERVMHHVRRLEQSAESAIQIHFSAQGQRTNDVMRLLTVLTAVFLPLNLMAGIFGMNFDNMPLLHWHWGFVGTLVAMALIAGIFSWYFWRKRYLEQTP